MTTKLHALIGVECKLESTSATLREYVEELAPAAVGACHVTCSDESERECAEAFRRWFAGRLLPELKPADRAVFHTVNLGARYEWGTVRVAEEHYAVPNISARGFNLMLVKINSHVAVRDADEGLEYGWLDRYGCRSACCGALTALMKGSQLPAVRELEGLFALDGLDRLGTLLDVGRVPIERRALLAAAVNTRLQARRAAADVEEHRPRRPALFLVVPCVTINRPGPDTELVVGRYEVDWRGDAPTTKYRGLGDDPAAYRVTHQRRRVLIEDDQWPEAADR